MKKEKYSTRYYGIGLFEYRRLEDICKKLKLKPTKKLAKIYKEGIENGKKLEKEIWP